jgi:hypothetical protein
VRCSERRFLSPKDLRWHVWLVEGPSRTPTLSKAKGRQVPYPALFFALAFPPLYVILSARLPARGTNASSEGSAVAV